MNQSMTQKAKRLFESLVEAKLIEPDFIGLYGNETWVSRGNRAYNIRDLSDEHLSNIVLKYMKKEQGVPQQFLMEQVRRLEEKEKQNVR